MKRYKIEVLTPPLPIKKFFWTVYECQNNWKCIGSGWALSMEEGFEKANNLLKEKMEVGED